MASSRGKGPGALWPNVVSAQADLGQLAETLCASDGFGPLNAEPVHVELEFGEAQVFGVGESIGSYRAKTTALSTQNLDGAV